MSHFSGFFPKKWVKRILPLAFILGLLANFPASLVWDYAAPHLNLPRQLSVSTVGGSVWQGEAVLAVADRGRELQFKTHWQLGLSALWQHGEWAALSLRHPGSQLDLVASPGWSFSSVSGQLSGQVHPLLLNPFLKQNKAWISGVASINDLAFSYADGRPQSLSGAVIWQGGDTYFLPPGAGSPQLIRYPQLAIRATTTVSAKEKSSDEIRVVVTQLGQEGVLVEAALKPDGWLSARVNGRLKQAVPDLPVPRKPADQALVKYKEKLF